MARKKPLESKKFWALLLGIVGLLGMAVLNILFAINMNLYAAIVAVTLAVVFGFIIVGYVLPVAALDAYTHGVVEVAQAVSKKKDDPKEIPDDLGMDD